MDKRTFFDMHLHAFNLSHPSFSVFVRRLLRELPQGLLSWRRLWRLPAVILVGLMLLALWMAFVVVYCLPPARRVARSLIHALFGGLKRMAGRLMNLLFVMENDIGSMFLLVENCLRDPEAPLLRSDGLHVGGERYGKVVLTPLMMDFGYKDKTPPGKKPKRWLRYDVPAERPIVEQVEDLFRGIREYVRTESNAKVAERYPALRPETPRVFEIYPFLGLNPANYTMERIEGLLAKYFGAYTGRREDFRARLGEFDGDIERMGSHFFAGIKVYPPLGFDPWPEGDEEAMGKVKLLYATCSEKGIPLTSHGGGGGFVAVRREVLKAITDVAKWAAVLQHYPDLTVNLAHFPPGKGDEARRDQTVELALKCENVYVDISCRATSEKYYRELRKLLDGLSEADARKLKSRILFGTDFAVNLMWIDSYNHYLRLFSETWALSPEEKEAMCSTNPERFLFRG